MRAAVTIVLLAGCGRLGFGEARERGDAAIDSAIDAVPLPPWGAPAPIAQLNTSDLEDDASLTADMLEVFFDSGRPPGAGLGDIWTAKRASVTDPFGAPTLVVELDSPADDTTPEIAPDGLELYWSSDRNVAGNRDIWVATRATRQSAWANLRRVTELASGGADGDPQVLSDNKTMYFSSTRLGTNNDIMLATRPTPASPWQYQGPVLGVSELSREESQHWISDDQLTIYFSTTDGTNADILMATRASKTDPFGPATSMWSDVNTAAEEADPWVSPDQRTMVLTSDRDGTRDFYIMTR